jgi:hypothetical protein
MEKLKKNEFLDFSHENMGNITKSWKMKRKGVKNGKKGQYGTEIKKTNNFWIF